jgi:hypothetical protein
MNTQQMSLNRFNLMHQNYNMTAAEHAELIHGYLVRFPSVRHIKPIELSEDEVYYAILARKNNFDLGEMRHKVENAVFSCDNAKLKFFVALFKNEQFVKDLYDHGFEVKDLLKQDEEVLNDH